MYIFIFVIFHWLGVIWQNKGMPKCPNMEMKRNGGKVSISIINHDFFCYCIDFIRDTKYIYKDKLDLNKEQYLYLSLKLVPGGLLLHKN